jgi:hypothetical protein
MLNLVQLGAEEEDYCNTPKCLASETECSSYTCKSAETASNRSRKRTGSSEEDVSQPVTSKKIEKPCYAKLLPRDQSALAVPIRNFCTPEGIQHAEGIKRGSSTS